MSQELNIQKMIREMVGGAKYRFKDSSTNMHKLVHNIHKDEDIVLTLPDESGVILTTSTLLQILSTATDEDGVGLQYIYKPDITENNAGIIEPIGHNKPLRISSYKTSDAFQGLHEKTEWQASFSKTFTNIVDHTDDVEYKAKWLPNIYNLVQTVYVRYRFISGHVMSPWSDTIMYVTPSYGLMPFTIKVGDTVDPIIKLSGFKAIVQKDAIVNHIATRYQIIKISTGVIVYDEKTTDLLTHKINHGVLETNTKYRINVIQYTDNKHIPLSKVVTLVFKTPLFWVETPTLRYERRGTKHYIHSSPFYYHNGTDVRHVSTIWQFFELKDLTGRLVSIGNGDYDINAYRVMPENTNDQMSMFKFDITGICFNGDKVYVAKVYYWYTTRSGYSSKTRTRSLVFKVKEFKADPITIDVVIDENTLLPVIKYSPYNVPGIEDNIKDVLLMVTWNRKADTSNHLRNIEMYHKHAELPNELYRKAFQIPVKPEDFVDTRNQSTGALISWNHKDDVHEIPKKFTLDTFIQGVKFNTKNVSKEFEYSIDLSCVFTGNISQIENNRYHIAIIKFHKFLNIDIEKVNPWLRINKITYKREYKMRDSSGRIVTNIEPPLLEYIFLGSGSKPMSIPDFTINYAWQYARWYVNASYTVYISFYTNIGYMENVSSLKFDSQDGVIQKPTMSYFRQDISWKEKINVSIGFSGYSYLPFNHYNNHIVKTELEIYNENDNMSVREAIYKRTINQNPYWGIHTWHNFESNGRSGVIRFDRRYKARVRHIAANGIVSEWSDPMYLTIPKEPERYVSLTISGAWIRYDKKYACRSATDNGASPFEWVEYIRVGFSGFYTNPRDYGDRTHVYTKFTITSNKTENVVKIYRYGKGNEHLMAAEKLKFNKALYKKFGGAGAKLTLTVEAKAVHSEIKTITTTSDYEMPYIPYYEDFDLEGKLVYHKLRYSADDQMLYGGDVHEYVKGIHTTNGVNKLFDYYDAYHKKKVGVALSVYNSSATLVSGTGEVLNPHDGDIISGRWYIIKREGAPLAKGSSLVGWDVNELQDDTNPLVEATRDITTAETKLGGPVFGYDPYNPIKLTAQKDDKGEDLVKDGKIVYNYKDTFHILKDYANWLLEEVLGSASTSGSKKYIIFVILPYGENVHGNGRPTYCGLRHMAKVYEYEQVDDTASNPRPNVTSPSIIESDIKNSTRSTGALYKYHKANIQKQKEAYPDEFPPGWEERLTI